MKRALVALIAGTVLSGLAAAYATTIQRAPEEAPSQQQLPDAHKLALN